ncbi:MAG TPA: hypothetical protein VK467_11640 [Gemmatimonadales bacterium]|nr:hypothetical protein [Gemmatimonadales bacterium]
MRDSLVIDGAAAGLVFPSHPTVVTAWIRVTERIGVEWSFMLSVNESLEVLAQTAIAETEARGVIVEATMVEGELEAVGGPKGVAVLVLDGFSVTLFKSREQALEHRRLAFDWPEDVRVANDGIGQCDDRRRAKLSRFAHTDRE